MAIGDDAVEQGYPLVPNTGEEGKVRYGAREINRTRDFIAQLAVIVRGVTTVARGGTGGTNKSDGRKGLGIDSGTSLPSNSVGSDGDIFFKVG